MKKITSFLLTGVLLVISCNNPQKELKVAQSPAEPKALKQNSPEDNNKKQRSKELMDEIIKQLNFIPNMNTYLNLVNQCKDNHLFVNADNQGYIIVVVSDKGFSYVPANELDKLKDNTGKHKAYQLKFLLQHILSNPQRNHPGLVYRSLGGEDLIIPDSRFDIQLKDKRYPIISALKFSEKLEIIAVDSVLYR